MTNGIMNANEKVEHLSMAHLRELKELKQKAFECAQQIPAGKPAGVVELFPILQHLSLLEQLEPWLIEAAETGVSWKENSSLEKWFPFSAIELSQLREQNRELAERIKRFVHVRQIPEYNFSNQLEINISIDKAVAREMPMEELLPQVIRDAVEELKIKANV